MSNPISHQPITSNFGDARPEGRDTQVYNETTGAAQSSQPFSSQGIANDVHKFNVDSSRSSDPLSQHGIPRPGEHQDSSSKAFTDVANDVHKYNIEQIGQGGQSPVSHHIHKENEPLPGAAGGAPTFDYSSSAITNANIPKSELGVKPTTDVSGLAVHDTHSPLNFSAQEKETRDGPGFAGATVSPYERTVLKSALENSTTDSQEFERNPLKTPDESHKKTPFNVGTTEEKNPTYGTGSHGLGNTDHATASGDHAKHSTTGSDHTKPSVGQKVAGTAEKATDQTKKAAQSAVGHNKSTGNTDTNRKDTTHTADSTTNTTGSTGVTKPSLGDKIIGATEKLAGKITGNAELQEKGQIKKQGGDATVSKN